MTEPAQESQVPVEGKPSDKELNFRSLEARYQKQLEQERGARLEAERRAEDAMKQRQTEEEDDDEPYIDKKKLQKTLSKFGEQTKKATQGEIQTAVHVALQEERKQNWLKQNKDFYDVLQHAEKLAQQDPELAETILEMPEGFERQKLVYKNIKALGLDKPAQKQPSIQEKVDANRRGPFYQPSGVGNAPYQSTGNFSPQGQKEAYQRMQELKRTMRLG